jgi:hypothetical protein
MMWTSGARRLTVKCSWTGVSFAWFSRRIDNYRIFSIGHRQFELRE